MVCFEPVGAAFGALLRFWGDQVCFVQDPADRGGRRGARVFVFEVPGDGDRASVQSGVREDATQGQDAGSHGFGGGGTVAAGAPTSGLDRVPTALFVSSDQFVDPSPGHPVAAGDLGLRLLPLRDGQNNQTRFRHPSSSRTTMNDVPTHL